MDVQDATCYRHLLPQQRMVEVSRIENLTREFVSGHVVVTIQLGSAGLMFWFNRNGFQNRIWLSKRPRRAKVAAS